MRIGCVIGWNDVENLRISLPALRPHVDRLIYVDGRYKDFPGDGDTSDDGSFDVALDWCNDVLLPTGPGPWASEIEKRNHYLLGDPGDLYVVVDADEILIGLPQWREGSLRLYRPDCIPPYPVFRVFEHREGIHYEHTHNCVVADGRILNHELVGQVIAGCALNHISQYRDEQRKLDKGTYIRRLQTQEKRVREELRL